MSLLIVGTSLLLNKSLSPLKQAKNETINLAEKKAGLAEAKDFYWYNGNDTYFTVTGKAKDGQNLIIIVKQDDGSIQSIEQKGTFSKAEAINKVRELEEPARILEARIGIHNALPIWEVSFRQEDGLIGYTMLSLATGEWVRTIKNI